jgi:chemotaxis protein CheX
MSATITLPAILDLRAAAQLKADIQPHAGAALDLDASRVERLGGLCLQVLIAAEAQWRATGHGFRLINAGHAIRGDLRLMNAVLPMTDNGSAPSC